MPRKRMEGMTDQEAYDEIISRRIQGADSGDIQNAEGDVDAVEFEWASEALEAFGAEILQWINKAQAIFAAKRKKSFYSKVLEYVPDVKTLNEFSSSEIKYAHKLAKSFVTDKKLDKIAHTRLKDWYEDIMDRFPGCHAMVRYCKLK